MRAGLDRRSLVGYGGGGSVGIDSNSSTRGGGGVAGGSGIAMKAGSKRQSDEFHAHLHIWEPASLRWLILVRRSSLQYQWDMSTEKLDSRILQVLYYMQSVFNDVEKGFEWSAQPL